MPLELFYSYSREDETLRNQLNRHLSALEREGLIVGWHDRNISAGSDWRHQIDEHLRSAHIILFLVSSDFIASDYCYDMEVREALERHSRHETVLIPIILRSVDWSRTPFAKLQPLPRDGKPVTSWANQDEAFTDIARGIREVVERYLPTSAAPAMTRETSKLRDSRVTQDRVLDAAIPSHIVKDLAAELLVQIHLPDSPGLKGVLQVEEDHEARPEDVRSKQFGVVFPLGPDGRPEHLKTTIRLDSPDFFPSRQAKNLYVPPDKDSDVVDFLLTPRRTGRLTVLVELQWEDALRGSRSLRTECVAEATSLPARAQMNVVRIPLSETGATPHESRVAQAAASSADLTRSAATAGEVLPCATLGQQPWADPHRPKSGRPKASVERAHPPEREYGALPSPGKPPRGSADAVQYSTPNAGVRSKKASRAMSSITRIVLALIAIVPATLVGYWQFVYKPLHPAPAATIFESVVVSGRVINAQTLAFVPNAQVILDVDNGAPPLETYTDSNGSFSFQLTRVKAGSQGRLSVRRSGFYVLEKNFHITDTTVREEFRLQTMTQGSPGPPRPISLVLAGRVINAETGAGLSHASISLAGRSENYLTDDNGNFRIRLAAPVSTEGVRLQVKKTGCYTQDVVVTPAENQVFGLSCESPVR